MRRAFLLLVVVGLFLSLGARQAEKSYHAQRFEVTAEVLQGGSLQVHESVVFDFRGGPFTFVFRELPADFNDGIVDIVAIIDGRVLPEGDGPGQVEIEGSNPIRVTWHMEPTSDQAREFGLDYTMLGVVRQEQNADLLWWWPLPDAYEYAIGDSQVTINYPPDWPLASQPSVARGQATITAEPGQVRFDGGAKQPNDPLLMSLPFEAGSVLTGPPAWQAQQQQAEKEQAQQKARQDDLAWIWIGLGGLILAGGTALLFRALRPFGRKEKKTTGLAYEPPGDLPPALGGLLRSQSASVTWDQAQGALFDLAGRGYLMIEQLPKRRWSGHDFAIKLTAEPHGLRPHEANLIELLLADKNGRRQDSTKMSSLRHVISSKRWKVWSETLEAEAQAQGYLSVTRQKARGRIMAMALAPLGLLVVVAVMMFLRHSSFGWWPLFLAGALLLLTIMWIVGGSSISALSDDGARQAAEWEPFYRYLKEVSRGKSAPANEDEFERYLPYAAAYGLLHSWAKRFEKRGWTETPAYFRPLGDAGRSPAAMGAFVAMTAVTASSGGSAASGATGAAGAAGAAGGGASGAG